MPNRSSSQLAIARDGCFPTPAIIERAARKAQIHEKILSFEDQYETEVGERGARLSGGERQRGEQYASFFLF